VEAAIRHFLTFKVMKIALVSFECPPDTAFGGIGTYVGQAAMVLAGRGHEVEIFAASQRRTGTFREQGITTHLVYEESRERFASTILPIFSARQATVGFDVVESPEYMADGREIRRAHPQLAHVVKLHAPQELLLQLATPGGSFKTWLAHQAGQLRQMAASGMRGKSLQYQPYRVRNDFQTEMAAVEKLYAQQCDLTVSPSQALMDWAIREWGVDCSMNMVVPNPYVPSAALLRANPNPPEQTVGYFGRLQQTKGIEDLITAIPLVLAEEPGTRFIMVGKIMNRPETNQPYDDYVRQRLGRWQEAVEIAGHCPLADMAKQYERVSICTFPSYWETFPNVCLEAMSAGRAVVASSAGGMTEMLEGGKHGILIPPRSPELLAKAVIQLIRSPDLRKAFGTSARAKVLSSYNAGKIGPLIEHSYELAVENGKRRP
jgi:glycogen(starch) synthase